ncbi:MAG TPA: hypothetical protein DGR97_02190 [Gammaproteobacteria bacterium]|nr:hypothetical protein [Gammaproteobacteria bacterium]|tara:strand:- start:4293 stop:4868 length:576 start_codon:yes stop_codon:yes gene_type:complete
MTKYFDNALYESVESSLSLMGSDISASECHGMLCGILCSEQQFDAGIWLSHAVGYGDGFSGHDLGAGHALTQLLDDTVDGFSTDDFSLQLLLPSDDHSLRLRAQALGCWCRGFLSGYGLGGLDDLKLLSDDSQGFLRDLVEIGRVDLDKVSEVDDEFAFVEICEYTRMGTLLLREENLESGGQIESGGTEH